MSRTEIQNATDRLRALVTIQPLSSQLYMTGSELFRADVSLILDELHRLHIAVSTQEKRLDAIKRGHRKPPERRTPKPTTGNTKEKHK